MKEKRAVTQLEMLLFKRRENISTCKPEKRQETKFHLQGLILLVCSVIKICNCFVDGGEIHWRKARFNR
ncbi:hypothetical protein P5673_008791 [Acropora cervicornis]|uniref:Uncharacterized protein n=1 Tax=Acropora cervicornis TaxID=6130 RepID=A0AAD9VA93_ACRCE|nr:hypothetical protein P5673_008791 [Acropora cervicornis]